MSGQIKIKVNGQAQSIESDQKPTHLFADDAKIVVCKINGESNGELSVMPMAEFANEIFVSKNLVKPMVIREFKNAWRHPCGGSGHIFGWEII